MAKTATFDVLVIGSGAAGLSVALRLPGDLSVAVLSKGPLDAGSTENAQGGIAAVLADDDSVESHIEDTMAAGAGLCDREIVRHVAEQGPAAIDWLIAQGAHFTENSDGDGSFPYHLSREGGHSRRRVIHAKDSTGHEVQTTLETRLGALSNVTVLENRLAVDLIVDRPPGEAGRRCVGAYVYDRDQHRVATLGARVTVLATGGASKVYLYTSNPDGSTGDGIAMAWRAGCRVANMEFNQFHPTCLYHPRAKSFLLTEALRGEGAKLRLPDGSTFMEKFDPRGELAPRDIVARAIDDQMKRLGLDYIHLDISHRDDEFIIAHFPTIHRRCLEFGFDLTKEPVPVVPAAHYTCGGVMTDRRGRSDVDGLYVVGEAAHTGLHGANRMASNSLLECLVFGAAAAADIARRIAATDGLPELPRWDESRVTDSDEEVVVSHNWHELRRFMWNYVGIVRTEKRLERAHRRIDMLGREIAEYYGNFRVNSDLLELRNLTLVANLMVRSAMARKESRGLHYTLDYPQPDNSKPPENTILVPKAAPS